MQDLQRHHSAVPARNLAVTTAPMHGAQQTRPRPHQHQQQQRIPAHLQAPTAQPHARLKAEEGALPAAAGGQASAAGAAAAAAGERALAGHRQLQAAMVAVRSESEQLHRRAQAGEAVDAGAAGRKFRKRLKVTLPCVADSRSLHLSGWI